jgi:hypothetical protein
MAPMDLERWRTEGVGDPAGVWEIQPVGLPGEGVVRPRGAVVVPTEDEAEALPQQGRQSKWEGVGEKCLDPTVEFKRDLVWEWR